MNAEENDHINLASKLLNSKDEDVAAAAKRIFASALAVESSFAHKLEVTSTQIHTFTNPQACPVSNIIPSDIFRAASLLLAPKKTLKLFEVIGNRELTTPDSSNKLPITTESSQINPSAPNSNNDLHKRHVDERDRLNRSRERNKMHARKTRQRKKEQMSSLEQAAQDLKKVQIQLKTRIEEKCTANILIDLCSKAEDGKIQMDPRVDRLLKRKHDDIPDSTKIPELPSLILPGNQHRRRKEDEKSVSVEQEYPDDGIDYDLLAKDRSTCSQEELDQIRRERNRMHAKRTRDRKKVFIDRMEIMVQQLEEENRLLEEHLEFISSCSNHDDIVHDSHLSKAAVISGETTPAFNTSPKIISVSNSSVGSNAPLIKLLEATTHISGDPTYSQHDPKHRGNSITSSENTDHDSAFS